ncbi:uncharacterized protein LOC114351048 [Ostrinia furnacalis]|uniref:uncharacterized protein LOC114351048 n=1 Tax=Ostrinia furnacalis TaxID=93504 RepID=UPI001038F218|nr:uncharacterized protein LOC114351048 [Ostrinia furnacalis]
MVGDPLSNHIDHNYNKCHRSCVVPFCPSTTEKTPEKLFVQVPAVVVAKEEWLRLAGCLPLPPGAHYFCEDHFDIQHDMVNYSEYKIMGHVQRVRLKAGCLPSKFACQQHHEMLPLNAQKSNNRFKINVVHGQNILAIETIPQVNCAENNMLTKKGKKKAVVLSNIKKRIKIKPTITKSKNEDDSLGSHTKRVIVIKPNSKKVKIIKGKV